MQCNNAIMLLSRVRWSKFDSCLSKKQDKLLFFGVRLDKGSCSLLYPLVGPLDHYNHNGGDDDGGDARLAKAERVDAQLGIRITRPPFRSSLACPSLAGRGSLARPQTRPPSLQTSRLQTPLQLLYLRLAVRVVLHSSSRCYSSSSRRNSSSSSNSRLPPLKKSLGSETTGK